MLVYSTATPPDCRSVVVPSCEGDVSSAQDADITALALFQLRLRDEIDFKVDFSQWLQANGGAQISNATFAAAATSPSAPSIVSQAFSANGKCVVVLAAPNGAKAGDAYWIDVTVTVAAVAAATANDVAIPQRTLVRRINVVAVNG